jgi:hypothetical protein
MSLPWITPRKTKACLKPMLPFIDYNDHAGLKNKHRLVHVLRKLDLDALDKETELDSIERKDFSIIIFLNLSSGIFIRSDSFI